MATMKQGWLTLLERFPHARLLWEAGVPGNDRPDGNGIVRAFSVNGCAVIIHDYNPPNGWQAYTPTTESGEITKTLDAIDARTRGVDYDWMER